MPDDVTPDPEATPERPEWLLPKYDSVDAQAQAYAESQAEMNRMRSQMEQERQSFTAALEGFQQQPAPPPQQFNGQQYDPALSAYTQAWEQGDVQGMLAAQAQYTMNPTIEAVGRLIDEKLGSLTPAVEQAQAAMRESNLRLAEGLVERELGPERYTALIPKVSEMVASDRSLMPDLPSVEAYRDRILFLARNAEHEQLMRENEAFRQEQQDKRNAQTLSGGYNRPAGDPDADRAEFERIKNTPTGSFAELLANNARRQA